MKLFLRIVTYILVGAGVIYLIHLAAGVYITLHIIQSL